LGSQGQLILDIELLDAYDDEADLGYYTDEGLTLEEVQEVVKMTDLASGGNGQMQGLPGQIQANQIVE
jgi:hypothetical protein